MEDVSDVVISLNISAEGREEFVCRAYEEHRGAIYRHMIALGLDPCSAQDLTQETFLSLFESLSKAQRIQRLRPWLFAVASRLGVKHLEKLRGEAILNAPDMAVIISALADEGKGPEQSALFAERKRALAAAMQALSPQQRVCLHLRAEGLRYREIAEAASLSIPSVAEFLRRAITRLRSVLDGK
jgi:RNA polymerase sigma-70 factor (ECF subfamily)